MDMLGYACVASLNVILMSGYGTIMSEYALKNRDKNKSSSSLLYQAAWHYDYVKIRMCITMSGYGSIKPENGILFFQNIAFIVRTYYYVTHHFKSDVSCCANNRLNSSNPAIGNEMNRALCHLCAHIG